jgi:hypothetical protein
MATNYLLGYKDALRAGRFIIQQAKGLRTEIAEETPVAISYLGNPIFDQITFPKDGNEQIELSEDFNLTEVLLTIDRPKNIVRTRVQGRDGDVNEFIGLGDYNISIRGVLVNENILVRPTEKLTDLLNISNHAGAVAVASGLLNLLGVESIVIDRLEINEVAGFRNQVPFTLDCRSERSIELEISNDVNT